MKIVQLTGLSYPSVRKAIDLFNSGGWQALQPAARGRAPQASEALTDAQQALLRQAVLTPGQPQPGLWSIQAVIDYAAQHWGAALSEAATQRLLSQWGLALQRPSVTLSNSVSTQWLQHDYPALRRKARASGTAVYWLLTQAVQTDLASPAAPLATPAPTAPLVLAAVATRAHTWWRAVPRLELDALKDFIAALQAAARAPRLLLLVPEEVFAMLDAVSTQLLRTTISMAALEVVQVPNAQATAASAAPLASVRAGRKQVAEKALIAAAIKVIADKGVTGLTLAEVAMRAGFTKTLVSHHFGSREELILRILVHLRENFGQRITRNQAHGMQALDAFLCSFAQEFTMPSRYMNFYTSVLASALFESQAFAQEIDQINTYSLDFIRTCLRYEQARGATFIHGDLDATAEYIFCCVRGLMLVHGLKRRVNPHADISGALEVSRSVITSSIVRWPSDEGFAERP